jgi:hypothetical protein
MLSGVEIQFKVQHSTRFSKIKRFWAQKIGIEVLYLRILSWKPTTALLVSRCDYSIDLLAMRMMQYKQVSTVRLLFNGTLLGDDDTPDVVRTTPQSSAAT